VQHGPDVPHWLPADQRWEKLPESIRQVVPRILAPAYRRFVIDAADELERSVGLTLVHLMWLEVCDQVQLATAIADPTCLDAILKDPETMIDRHLRLATVKCQTAELLLKLRVVSEALQRPPHVGCVKRTDAQIEVDYATVLDQSHSTPIPHLPRESTTATESEIGKSPTC
jgi:hypothetical protein